LNGFARLCGKKNLAPIIDPIGSSTLGCAAFPYSDLESPFDWATGVIERNLQRERSSKLKNAMKTDLGINDNLCAGKGRGKNSDDNGRQKHERGEYPRPSVAFWFRKISEGPLPIESPWREINGRSVCG